MVQKAISSFELFPYDKYSGVRFLIKDQTFFWFSIHTVIAFPKGLTNFNVICPVPALISVAFANFLGITYLTVLICMLSTTHQLDIFLCLRSLTVVLCWLRMLSVFTDPEPGSVTLSPLSASRAEHIQRPEADTVHKA